MNVITVSTITCKLCPVATIKFERSLHNGVCCKQSVLRKPSSNRKIIVDQVPMRVYAASVYLSF